MDPQFFENCLGIFQLQNVSLSQSQFSFFPRPLPRGDLTLYVSLPRPCCASPTRLGRRATSRKQHDTVMQVPPLPSHVQGGRVILLGIPLSLISKIYPQCTTKDCQKLIFGEIFASSPQIQGRRGLSLVSTNPQAKPGPIYPRICLRYTSDTCLFHKWRCLLHKW